MQAKSWSRSSRSAATPEVARTSRWPSGARTASRARRLSSRSSTRRMFGVAIMRPCGRAARPRRARRSGRDGREAERLLAPEAEEAEAAEAVVEQPGDAVLERRVEVDEHVAAEDHVELVEAAVGGEVVLCEDDVRGEIGVEARRVVSGDVIGGEVARAARADVVLGVRLHPLEREDARPRRLDRILVDVGRIDAGAFIEAFFVQEDRQRVDLFPGRASGTPDPGERIRVELRHDVLSERPVERGIAEHRRDVDRQVEEQPLHAGGVAQQQALELGERLDPLGGGAAREPPPQRRDGVVPEVEPVAAVDRLEQELELDLVARRSAIEPNAHEREQPVHVDRLGDVVRRSRVDRHAPGRPSSPSPSAR